MSNRELITTDVLILGSGIAGCTTALELADAGITVTLATRAQEPEESNTLYAQGGIVYTGHDDSPETLASDIIRAGAGHCNLRAVQILAEEGPSRFRHMLLDRVGVSFDREPDGELSLVREGGHSVPRVVHVADATGKAIETALISAVSEHANIHLLTAHTAVDLLTPSHHGRNRLSVYDDRRVVGAYLFDQGGRRVVRCVARCTVLATGGLGHIYLRSSNPEGARGGGLAIAYRAGARVINAEFVQFHPTTFHHQLAPHFLVSEAVRGAGARLVSECGEPVMQRYAPEWQDLAPRDVVARSIHHEMLEQGVPNVYLDLVSYVSREEILDHFPNIYESCLEYGVDITKDLVPVVPAAHYACGGVWVDEWGHSTIRDLYAVGEVSCTGLHGANRLASTSLLEAVVWGCRTAEHIGSQLETSALHEPEEIPPWVDDGLVDPDPALISQDMTSIQHIMWNYVGLVRTTHRLRRAIHDLRNLETQIEDFYHNVYLSDGLIGLRNAVRAALIVTLAAWSNRKNMGAHYRE
jgi:L-aspartate oxidase